MTELEREIENQHIFDVERRFNGTEGRWAVCGRPMPLQDPAGPGAACVDCRLIWDQDRRG